jgi:mannosyltransferase
MTARKARRSDLLVLVLAWVAFGLRVVGLDFQSLWRDEVDALRFATRSLPELFATFRQPGENGPLFFLTLRPWLAVGGHSEFSLRFPSAWMGALAVPMVYVLLRRLTGRRPALLAALLAVAAPYLVWYGQEAKMYAALTLFVLLSLWLTIQAMQRGRWWRWLLLYAVTSCCFYVHLLAVLVVPVQVLWILVLPVGWRPARRWLAAAAYLAALLMPYLPLLRWQVGMWQQAFETGHPFVPIGDILAVMAVAYGRGVLAVKAPLTLLPVILALVAGLVVWATREPASHAGANMRNAGTPPLGGRWRVVGALAGWLFLPPLAVYGISLRVPVFTDRYLIWCMPAFLALVSLGVVALAGVWRPLGVAVLAGILVASLAGVWAQSSQPIKADFRAAADFVRTHQQPGDLLLFQIPYGRYTFSYYSNDGVPDGLPMMGGLSWVEGPFTNNGASEAAVAEQMAEETNGARAVWLIASEAPLWDQRELTRRWLSERGRVTDQAEFARVSVARYQLVNG